MNRSTLTQYFSISALLIIVFECIWPYTLEDVIVIGDSSTSNANQNGLSDDRDLSVYENHPLRFRLKYPSDFQIAEITGPPNSDTIVFRKAQMASGTGAFFSVNVTKWDRITFDELRRIMSNEIGSGPGTYILDENIKHISGIQAYKVVQKHTNSPYGRDATVIYMGAVRDNTSYILSSMSTDMNSLQEIFNSFEFTR